MSDHQSIRSQLIRRLAALEVTLTVLEVVVIIGPLTKFFGAIVQRQPVIIALTTLLAIWLAMLWVWLRPIRSPLPDESAAEICARIRKVPQRTMVLRLVFWAGVGGLIAAILTSEGVLKTTVQGATLVAVCCSTAFGVALFRLGITMRLLRTALRELGLRQDWLAEQAETLFDQLTEVALVIGAASGSFSALFLYLFVPVSQQQYLQMVIYFTPAGAALGFVWYFMVAPRQIQPLARFLEKLAAHDEADVVPDVHEVRAASIAAHRLPLTLAITKVVFFGLAGGLLSIQALALYGFTIIQAAMSGLAIGLVAVGFGTYEYIWAHSLLQPIAAYLQQRQGQGSVARVGATLPLQRKMLLTFGGAMVFTVLLALFWSYLQQGNLRVDFAVTQARRELTTAKSYLSPAKVRSKSDLGQLVAKIPVVRGSRYLHVPQVGVVDPLLPQVAADTVRREESGVLDLTDLGLAGVFQQVYSAKPSFGSLLVLVPIGRSERPTLDVNALLWFFGIVLALALGLVLVTSASFTRPLAALERGAAEIAAGRLDRPVRSGAGFDEIGSLTNAFEEMRVALKEKLHTIEELNAGLEQTVQERTAELQTKNEELQGAIAALTEAQDKLLLSEKMASVGQLVAGVAHEINNPINAVSNVAAPLAETIEELVEASTVAEGNEEKVDEIKQDLQQMLRVIRSGTGRTKKIVGALRNFARGDADERTAIDIHADIDETLALLTHRMRGIEIVREFELRDQLHGFRGRLNQALLNLLANAAAALAGRDDGRITVRTNYIAEKDAARIEIADNGPGIPEETQARVFDPFFTTKDVGEGTGLGLSITHRIIDQHGGTISLQSSTEGTTFTIELPVEQEQ